MIDVQNLINNIKTVTSKALCTWGEFITFLSTELQYFKQKGGIQVNPPTVVLPDGVTTTTLISQSEMTQFVTNTLNVWIASINNPEPSPEPSENNYNLLDILKPKAIVTDAPSSSTSMIRSIIYNCDVDYFDNVDEINNRHFDYFGSTYNDAPILYGIHESTHVTQENWVLAREVMPPLIFNRAGQFVGLFTNEPLIPNYSNIHSLMDNTQLNVGVLQSLSNNSNYSYREGDSDGDMLYVFTTGSLNAATIDLLSSKTCVVLFTRYNNILYPLCNIFSENGFFVNGNSKPYIGFKWKRFVTEKDSMIIK